MRSIRGVDQIYERLERDFRARPSIPIDLILSQFGAVDTVKSALSGLIRLNERALALPC